MSNKLSKAEMKKVIEDYDFCKSLDNGKRAAIALEQALEYVPDDIPKEDGLYQITHENINKDVLIFEAILYWVNLNNPVKKDDEKCITWDKRIMKPDKEQEAAK